MKISWKKLGQLLLLGAFVLLVFRRGTFATSFSPKPYEIALAGICILTAIMTVVTNRTREFVACIPKQMRIALMVLCSAIAIGWGSAFVQGITSSQFNVILEFGTFCIGVITFVLVLFYTNTTDRYATYILYALLVPGIFGLCILAPQAVPNTLLARDGNFLGLTTNVNIISKILLVPTLFALAGALYKNHALRTRILFGAAAAMLVGMLFWIASRGAIVSLIAGAGALIAAGAIRTFRWKDIGIGIGMVLLIGILGFVITPYARKQVAVNRLLNADVNQLPLTFVQHQSVIAIVQESFTEKDTTGDETRFAIWNYYVRYTLFHEPLGVGPNTHISSGVHGPLGEMVSSGPHNTYLQALLWGGIIGFVAFLYMVYFALRHVYRTVRAQLTFIVFALSGILVALGVAIAFDDSFSLYIWWIVLALAVRTWNQQ